MCAIAAAVGFNMPAQAENQGCAPLQAAYVANPAARPLLLGQLQSLGCSIPITSSSTSSSSSSSSSSTSSSTTSSSTTSTTTLSCANLQAIYRSNPASASTILALLQAQGCSIPVTTSSSTTSSSTTSSTSATTSTTLSLASACPSLVLTYNSVPAEARAQLLPILQSLGCSVPNQT